MSVNTLVFEGVAGKGYVSVNIPDHAILSKERFNGLAFNEAVQITGNHIKFTLDAGTWVYFVDHSKTDERFIHLRLVKEPE